MPAVKSGGVYMTDLTPPPPGTLPFLVRTARHAHVVDLPEPLRADVLAAHEKTCVTPAKPPPNLRLPALRGSVESSAPSTPLNWTRTMTRE